MKRNRLSLWLMSALVALVLPTGVYATSAMASAQTTTTTTGKVAVVVAGSKLSVSPEMASKLSSSEGWSDLTMDQLSAAGIHPGMDAASSGRIPQARMLNKATSVVEAAGMVHPDSANRCNERVCRHVYGAGLVAVQPVGRQLVSPGQSRGLRVRRSPCLDGDPDVGPMSPKSAALDDQRSIASL